MLTLRAILPVTPLALKSMPLSRPSPNTRIKFGHYTGGVIEPRERALTAKGHRFNMAFFQIEWASACFEPSGLIHPVIKESQ